MVDAVHEQRKRNAGCRRSIKRPLLERRCTLRPDGVKADDALPVMYMKAIESRIRSGLVTRTISGMFGRVLSLLALTKRKRPKS